jgi:hypothetical protein
MFRVAPATRYLGHLPPGQKEGARRFDERYDLGGPARVPSVGRIERRCNALDLLSLASADDPFKHCPPYLINEVIVDRVVSSEHSIDKRPVECVDKGFQIEIG